MTIEIIAPTQEVLDDLWKFERDWQWSDGGVIVTGSRYEMEGIGLWMDELDLLWCVL